MTEANSFQKPTFDARIKFYEELFSLMQQSRILATMGEHRSWFRSLRLITNKVAPFITPKERQELTDMVKNAKNKVDRLTAGRFSTASARENFSIMVDNDLMELDAKIHDAAKRLMLPLQELETGEFDMERFMRESDLAG